MSKPIDTQLTRREFVSGMLAAGFAFAVSPVSAQTIITDEKGLTAGEVLIDTANGSIPAYRAKPAKGKNLPVVLVVQEIFGVHEHIRDVCRRLARQGYLALAPELYFRQGDVSKLTEIKDIREKVVSKVPDAQVMSDLDASLRFAKREGGDSRRAAITGFCWGGRIVWLYAAHNPDIKAGAAWYGRLADSASELTPKHPLDIAETLTVPVLGLYGGQDAGIPLADVERMRDALKKGTSGSEIIVYPDAPHAFNADYRPSYRKDAAEDAWKRMLAWFKKHGA